MNAAERKKKALNCDVIAQDKKRRRDSAKSAKDEDNCTKKPRKNAAEKPIVKQTTKPKPQTLTPHKSDNSDNVTPPPIRRDSVPVLLLVSYLF